MATPSAPPEHDPAQRGYVIWTLRALFLLLSVVVLSLGIVTGSADNAFGIELARYWWAAFGLTILFLVVVFALDVLTPSRKLSTISAVLFGLVAGLLATLVLGFVIDVFTKTYDLDQQFAQPILMAKVILGLGLVYLGITTVLQTQDDFRLVIPYVEFAKQYRGSTPLLIDTSALIDGRLLDLADAGFFQTPLLIPRFVLHELQTLSDSADTLRRARGRRGLDVVARLQRHPAADVAIEESPAAGAGVDQMLIDLAPRLPATVLTCDHALSRIASIRGVRCLNLNELARAMRVSLGPGEPLSLDLVRPGEHRGQAVGYLDDGTMVVVDDAQHLIGKHAHAVVTSTTQTSAGRLLFARLDHDEQPIPDTEAPAPAHTPTPPTSPQPESEPEPEPEPHRAPAPRRADPADTTSARNPRRR